MRCYPTDFYWFQLVFNSSCMQQFWDAPQCLENQRKAFKILLIFVRVMI